MTDGEIAEGVLCVLRLGSQTIGQIVESLGGDHGGRLARVLASLTFAGRIERHAPGRYRLVPRPAA